MSWRVYLGRIPARTVTKEFRDGVGIMMNWTISSGLIRITGSARASHAAVFAATARRGRLALAFLLSLWLVEAFSGVAAAHEGEVHITEGFALSPLALVVLGGLLLAILLAGFLLRLWAVRTLRKKENATDTGIQRR